MEINYFGQSCFLLKGKKTTLIIDPYSPEIGIKLPKLAVDIALVSHGHYDHNYTETLNTRNREEVFIINRPGEYEVSGISIFGMAAYHDDSGGKERGENIIFLISMDEVRLAHLGDLGHLLSDAQLEEINGVDVLFVPVGGTYTIGAREAVEVIGQIEPKIAIPMHYKLPGLKIQLSPVQDFLNEIGLEKVQPIEKLVVSREKLPTEREVVVLNAKT